MEISPFIGKAVLAVVVALVVFLMSRFARRNRRLEPGRVTGPATPGQPAGPAQSVEVPRQRPASSMKVFGVIFLACGAVLVPIAALIPDTAGVLVLGLIAIMTIVLGFYTLRSYQNCTLVDAPTMTIMTNWRGQEKQMVHEEITKYYPANRRTVIVRDQQGQKLSIDMVWFTTPLLARRLMQLEAEGRFAGNRLGDAGRISKGLNNVEYCFKVRFPDHYKAILLQGPGANPAAFQRDPAAPQGAGWTGPNYSSWLQALQAALQG